MENKASIASLYAHDFDLGLTGYFYVNDPSDILVIGKQDAPRNFAGWHDARFEQASRNLLVAPSTEARLVEFATMETVLAEEAPYLPLYHLNRSHLVSPLVRSWRENHYAQVDWREIWLEAKK